MSVALGYRGTVPVLRSYDNGKAMEFYRDWLGFTVDWEHRYGDNFPLYQQISRDGIVLHLSEHHGDGSPGANIRITVTGLVPYHAELIGKQYRNNRPGLEEPDWGGTEMTVVDPVGNRITLVEGG